MVNRTGTRETALVPVWLTRKKHTMENTVYVVLEHVYRDKRIIGVFRSIETARASLADMLQTTTETLTWRPVDRWNCNPDDPYATDHELWSEGDFTGYTISRRVIL